MLAFATLILLYCTSCMYCQREPEEVFNTQPVSQVVPKGENVSFFCNARDSDDALWKINGQLYVPNSNDVRQPDDLNGVFIEPPISNPSLGTYNLSLTVVTSLNSLINNTTIACEAHTLTGLIVCSDNATLTIIEPPSPPDHISIHVHNISSIYLAWERPFTWPGYPIIKYQVQLQNLSGGEPTQILLDGNVTGIQLSRVALEETCSIFKIAVTPVSEVGESQSKSFYTGFPILPAQISSPEVNTLFGSNDSPFLHIKLLLPAVCYYQEMNYTVMLQPDNNTTATTLTKTVQEGRVSSCPPDPGQSLLKAFEVSEIVPAALGVSYTVHVRADTIAGSSAADPVYISTAVDPPQSSKGKTDHAVYAILGVYSVTVSVLLCVSAVLLCVCHKKSRRFTVNEVGKAQRSMVNNPIYESQTTGPVYECIPLGSSNQQTNCDSPSAISVRYLEQPQKASPVTSSSPSTSTSDDDKSSMLAAESPESMKQQDETALSCGMQVRENLQLRLSRGDTKIHVNGTINLEPLQELMSPVEDGQSPQTMKGATTTTTTVLTMQGSTSRRDTAPVMIPTATRATADANYTIMSPAGTISHSALSAGWGDHSPVDSNKYAFAD